MVYEFSGPSIESVFGLLAIAILLIGVAIWFVLSMPWLSYGKVVSLRDFDNEPSNRSNSFVFGLLIGVIGISVGAFAVFRGIAMNESPDERYIDSLPIARGEISGMQHVVIPRSRFRGTKWCIGTFEVDAKTFDLSPGLNTTTICRFRSAPVVLQNGDFIEIAHDGGRIYRITKRRQVDS